MEGNLLRTVHVVTCGPGQVVRLELDPSVDSAAPVGRFFDGGPVEIMVGHVDSQGVRLVITAYCDLILRQDRVRY
jgi:hypothetical protein